MNRSEDENGILIPKVEVTELADDVDMGSAGKSVGKADSPGF